MPKTINVPDSVELTFTYRTDKEQLRENAVTATVVCDLSNLDGEQLLEWAYSNMVIGYQSKLRGKKPPTMEDDGKYHWKVPARGSRTVADPAKVTEQATKLIGKLDEEGKKQMVYETLLSLGKSTAEATAISGYTPKK